MKQVQHDLRTGNISVNNIPVPALHSNGILVQTSASLVSAGTERMVVDFAEKTMFQKARSRPDLVRQVWDKAQREGVLAAIQSVQDRLDQPLSLGYSAAGVIREVGEAIQAFKAGDRVACAGGGYAVHAEVISVPKNLAVLLPDNVPFEAAAFSTLGAISLQGVRLGDVKLGEIVAVIGLGLLGQLAVQILKANGCTVIGLDLRRDRAELALQLGADKVTTSNEELLVLSSQLSQGHGVDAVLITADTKSNDPVEMAGKIARNKGIVVAIGAVGMNIPRKIYYEKELDFRISRSYGPGRYDPEYEEKGHDYPYGYVRWTMRRNMEAFVQLLSTNRVDVHRLITHRFPVQEASLAYNLLAGKTEEQFLGIVLLYPNTPDFSRRVLVAPNVSPEPGVKGARRFSEISLGVLGAGNFATATLLPSLKKLQPIRLIGIASTKGLSARAAADRFGFNYCTTEDQAIVNDPNINTVAILTRHHLHARQVIAALNAGKHVYVEKPLCLKEEELSEIVSTYETINTNRANLSTSPLMLMVGFNRRFAPFVVELNEHLKRVQEPLLMQYRINAGYVAAEHWVQDPAQGGGRLLGECCHFIDLLIFLSGSIPQKITAHALPDSGRYLQDNLSITLQFANGSIGTVLYAASGHKGFSKESLEVFGGGTAARLEDFRTLRICHGDKRIKRSARLRQDKGHRAEWFSIVSHLTRDGGIPITLEEIVRSTEATFAAQRSLRTRESVVLN